MRPTTSGDPLATQLAEAAAEASRISRMVADSWWDDRGRELAQGIARVGHELDEHARRAARVADEVAGLLAGAGGAAAQAGSRLPSVGGRRESEERGVRLPLLDDGTESPPA